MSNLTLTRAMNDQALTDKGGRTLASSLDACVDLFFLAGASRGKDLGPQFLKAYAQDSDVAVRILQWMRDVRGGAGEREQFRNLFRTLTITSAGGPVARLVLAKIPEIGRWDDVIAAFDTELEYEALAMIRDALKNGMEAKVLLEQLDDMTEEECAVMLEKMGSD